MKETKKIKNTISRNLFVYSVIEGTEIYIVVHEFPTTRSSLC